MPIAVVTGCNSGIGHAFAQVLLKEDYYVYALDIEAGEKLLALQGPRCQIGRLDVTSIDSTQEFKKSLGDTKVDVLLNIAAQRGDRLPRPTPSTPLKVPSQSTLSGPQALLTQALLPNIISSTATPPHLAVMSSRVGSIADTSSGGSYAYRASKTAVNSIFKNMAVELKEKGVVVSMLHPGFTKSNLDSRAWEMKEAVEASEAAEKLWGVLKGKGMEETGWFWHGEGMELPW